MALDVLEQIHEQCGYGDLLQQSPPEQLAASADDVSDHQVDSFLREAVSSRNRITVLRLEQQIERFARNANEEDLLLKPMQSSYERLAAHRIAQHYGLQSMVVTAAFPKVSRILLVKTVETRLPYIRLADIPVESGLADKSVPVTREKIAIKQRVSMLSNSKGLNGSNESGMTPVKTMEEREEEYDKARARIFNSGEVAIPDNGESGTAGGFERQRCLESLSSSSGLISPIESKNQSMGFNRVAIFRDREKDMKDPDYDRSYRRFSQWVDPNASITFPTLHRMYSPTSPYNKYTRFDGQWASHLQVDQLTCMPALPFRGPRVESCYPDGTYMSYDQSHSDAYWRCHTFPLDPHSAHFNNLKDNFCFPFQHGLQSATSLGALGR